MFIDVYWCLLSYSVNHAQSAGLFCEGHNQADLRFIDGDLRRLMAGSQNVKRSTPLFFLDIPSDTLW